MTNYEKIKAMSVEDVVEFLSHLSDCSYIPDHKRKPCETYVNCDGCIRNWLLQEAEE